MKAGERVHIIPTKQGEFEPIVIRLVIENKEELNFLYETMIDSDWWDVNIHDQASCPLLDILDKHVNLKSE